MKDSPSPPPPPWLSRPEFEVMPEALRQAAEWRRFAAGEHLFRLGDRPQAMFFVVRGEVCLRRYSPDGSEVALQRARHNFLAEGSLESQAYHCDAVAIEASTALAFPMPAFRQAVDECSPFRSRWVSHLMREVRRSRAQCERLTLRTAAARILHFIECEGQNGKLELTFSRKAWAAELGISHEALYRTLAQMEKAGSIALAGRCVARR